ncbi:MAG: hypothetical protein EBS96_13300 [Spartobacteria bacterium]|nr:hypothetical protein [Spartobacteria bacterium]
METANSVYTNIVAAFKTAADAISSLFAKDSAVMMVLSSAGTAVGGIIQKTIFDSLAQIADQFPIFGDKFKKAMELKSGGAALAVDNAFLRIGASGELVADQIGETFGNIPDQFKANMAGVKPLFDTVTQEQDKIIDKNVEIGKSLDEAWKMGPRPQTFVEIAKWQQDELDKSNTLALQKKAEDERAANAEKARQEKLKESAALKREEVNLQIAISNAIAAGDTKQAEALKNAKALNATIQDLIKSGMGESEATKMANEMARAAREAERIKNSLATKIDEKIKSTQDTNAIDKGGVLQKRAEQQIASGNFGAARATGQQLAQRELEASVRGTGTGSDRRSAQDIAKDYFGSDWITKGTKETLDAIRKARDEGIYPGQDEMKKASTPNLDKMKPSGDQPGRSGSPAASDKKEPKATLDSIVQSILELVKKIEPKLPVAALVA